MRNGVASAGLVPVGREFLHYHRHSKASSPLGLPQRNAGLPTHRPCASLQTGFHRDKPGGEQIEVACEGSAETGFHRDKPGWGASPAILF